MLCRSVVFKGPEKVTIEEMDLPSPSPNQILVKTLVTLISTGTELTMLSGKFSGGSVWDNVTKYPMAPGYSNCGIIEEIGKNVKEFKAGDRVVSHGPHAEYVLIERRRAIKIPKRISDEEATFGILAQTAMNGVRLAHISLGECVVVVGLGILGQLACQLSRLCGGFPVIAVDLSEKRLEIAMKLGATIALQPEIEDVLEKVLPHVKGQGADVVFEVTGNAKSIPSALSLVKRQGRFVLLSSPRGPNTLDFHDYINWPSRIIIGAHASSHPAYETPYNPWTRNRNTELFFDLILGGLVNVKELITNIYPWNAASDVYENLLNPRGERLQLMGVLLDFR